MSLTNSGEIGVHLTELRYKDYSGDIRHQEGTLTGGTAVPASVWIQANKIYYADSSGNVRWLPYGTSIGTGTDHSIQGIGDQWVFYYDNNGDRKYWHGDAVHSDTAHTDNAWEDWYNIPHTNTAHGDHSDLPHEDTAHADWEDVAHENTAHADWEDVAHEDTAHSDWEDVAHEDSAHSDWEDVPHEDHDDHGDHGDYPYSDHSDHSDGWTDGGYTDSGG